MDPLSAFALWGMCLVAIAVLVKAARSAAAVPQAHSDDEDELRWSDKR